ncbi:hypothetical protein [Pelosinus baikalensis]|uniref:Uncharacterized protein n=1 Tax=Pelosinus baikalensis TaxID=2892015 RepID=A0ABS8HUF3_9FIRM|nr:hypothetical protein [Pelosinus baikalensis]
MGKGFWISVAAILIIAMVSFAISEKNREDEANSKIIKDMPTTYAEGLNYLKRSDYEKASQKFSLFHYKNLDKSVIDYKEKNFPNGKHLYNYANAMFYDGKAEFNFVDKYMAEIPSDYSGEFSEEILKMKKIDWAKKADDRAKIQVDNFMKSRQ